VLVEDLITTATSIVLFTNALRVANATIDHVSVVFARMTDAAQPALDDLNLSLNVLCDLETLLDMAQEEGVASVAEIAEVRAFLQDPEAWSAAR